ncbi:MAG: DUF917 domain-containing protein [Acidimicrobiia bacterium]
MWEITEQDLAPISIGAAILGTGGGGNPYLGFLRVRRHVRAGRRIEVIDPTEVRDSDLLVSTGGMGSPVVSYEKIAQGEEETNAVRALEEYLGRKFDAIAPFEMGGGNSMAPLVVSALLGIPVVDGDGMGRAFPELQMITYLIYGGPAFPSAIADERNNRVVFSPVLDASWLEKLARSVTIEMGGHAGLATAVMDGAHCRRTIIPNTLRLAHSIGRQVLEARRASRDPVQAVTDLTGGRRYLRGKVVDVSRRTTQGFAKGSITVEGVGDDQGRQIRIDFQNENLVIWEGGEPQVVVPDLITLVGTDDSQPITTELVRYGLRADVLVLPCPELLRTEKALAVVGPRAFGFEMDYEPFS